MHNGSEKYVFKITVVGDGSVGKTSLIRKFTEGNFQEEYIKTIGAQFSIYEMEIDGDSVTLFFWDIAGQDEFHFLRPSFYKDSKAAIIVYSLEENENNIGKNSLKHIPNWHNDILKFCGDIPIVVFANKVDLVDKENLVDTKILKIMNSLKGFRC